MIRLFIVGLPPVVEGMAGGAYLDDLHLIKAKEKNPILVHDLTLPGLPAPNLCITPVITATAASIPMKKAEGLVPAWRRSTKDRLVVVAVAPHMGAFFFSMPWPGDIDSASLYA